MYQQYVETKLFAREDVFDNEMCFFQATLAKIILNCKALALFIPYKIEYTIFKYGVYIYQ